MRLSTMMRLAGLGLGLGLLALPAAAQVAPDHPGPPFFMGLALAQTGRLAEARTILRWNVELFPESANVYDSLGEADVKAGDRAAALANYAKSLELDPKNKNAGKFLAEIKATPDVPGALVQMQALPALLEGRDVLACAPTGSGKTTLSLSLFRVLELAAGRIMLDGVDIVEDAKSVTYFHMLFDQHQIVYADGAMAESLYIGPEALLTVGKEAILEILRILPGLRVLDTDNLPQPARPLVRGRFARRFAYRHLQNNLPVCSPITAMEASKQRTSA